MSPADHPFNPVRQSFNRAAHTYTATATLQRTVADKLVTWIHQALPEHFSGRLLDAGCGTGYCTHKLHALFPAAAIIGLDFAADMLGQWPLAEQRYAINADIEQLPLAAGSIDCYVSSLAWQWCNPLVAARESQRTLGPTGQLFIATLSTGTFSELADCFQQLGLPPRQHVLKFATPETLIHALEQSGLYMVDMNRASITTWHADFRSLRHSIRGVGANHLPSRSAVPLSRAQRSSFLAAYEQLRTPLGLPLSYDVLTIHARKR